MLVTGTLCRRRTLEAHGIVSQKSALNGVSEPMEQIDGVSQRSLDGEHAPSRTAIASKD